MYYGILILAFVVIMLLILAIIALYLCQTPKATPEIGLCTKRLIKVPEEVAKLLYGHGNERPTRCYCFKWEYILILDDIGSAWLGFSHPETICSLFDAYALTNLTVPVCLHDDKTCPEWFNEYTPAAAWKQLETLRAEYHEAYKSKTVLSHGESFP